MPLSPPYGDQSVGSRHLSDVARRKWVPSGAIATNVSWTDSTLANAGALVSARLHLAGGMVLPGGRTVSSITFVSATTALVTGSNQWFCLVDQSRNVLAKTADDTSTAWAANTPKTLALSSAYTPAAGIEVYVGIVVVATTVPSLFSVLSNFNALNIAPIANGFSDTGLTNPASLGATAAALSAQNSIPFAYVS